MSFEIHQSVCKATGKPRTSRTVALIIAPEKYILQVGYVDCVFEIGRRVHEEFVNEREVRGDLL